MNMSRLLAGAALAGALVFGPLGAQYALAGECESPEDIAQVVLEAVPTSAVYGRYHGEEAATIIALVNAFPPETNYAGDEVLVFVARGLPTSLILIFKDGCSILPSGMGVEVPVQMLTQVVSPSLGV